MSNGLFQTKRLTVPAMEEIVGKEYKVLNHGLIRVVDYMGGDDAIVQMARVSYGQGTKTVNEDRSLIRYLVRNRHTSPLEGCELKLHLKMPIFVMRQWIRHRMASVNEYSARYSEMRDEFYFPNPEDVLGQSTSNKQGSDGKLDNNEVIAFLANLEYDSNHNYENYKKALEGGVARETAREGLTLNIYTECYWKIDLHNLLHFCSLRADSHAQMEIRVYAEIILDQIIKSWCPHTYEAFNDYVRYSAKFSKQEMDILRKIVEGTSLGEQKDSGLSKNEMNDFIKKLGISYAN